MVLKFSPAAEAALEALIANSAKATLLDRLNDLLDVLEDNPDDSRVRRRRFVDPPLWCFTVGDAVDTYLVLWELDAAGDPVVVHLGTASFS